VHNNKSKDLYFKIAERFFNRIASWLLFPGAYFLIILFSNSCRQSPSCHLQDYDLVSDSLASRWDEAIPLGNGMLGALLWQKEGKLRISLDRADLWDLRPVENFSGEKWKFSWVQGQWKNNNYGEVQKLFDQPYEANPGPTKIPAGAIEFDISSLGKIKAVRLSVCDALCEITWETGARFCSFIHATEPIGWYWFEGVGQSIQPELDPPPYESVTDSGEWNSVSGNNLGSLGYDKGRIRENETSIIYEQNGWGGFSYMIAIQWQGTAKTQYGCWSISSFYPGWEEKENASDKTDSHLQSGYHNDYATHKRWWDDFWGQSGINIPDSVLQRQWYLEMYKFGSTARQGAPPISLQAVWTADNGNIPPWKGDFHHDLNTQLSYWPAYSSNHLDLEKGFLDWLWSCKPAFRKYTQEYFETNGLNVPGVSTLAGEPMGGWIQYSFGPTVSAWLGQHFYLHWRYSKDEEFLKKQAYPWLHDVAVHLDKLSVRNSNGIRKLPLSSSPEIFDNSPQAWFDQTTNFDLSLIHWTFAKAAELAAELRYSEDAAKWDSIGKEWPELAVDEETGLMVAPGMPFTESHRHFSHLMAVHPLGLIDVSQGETSRDIVSKSINNLLDHGTAAWVGYSYSWLGNIQARALDGEGAANSLRIFAENFCSLNSFHVNGEQYNRGYSDFKYRPFTLEGNFAFAAGIQEMLIQNHTGKVVLFPAIPSSWVNISFTRLRAEGAFLISAEMKEGEIEKIEILPEKGGKIILKNPFKGDFTISGEKTFYIKDESIIIETVQGQNVILKPPFRS